MPHPMGFFLFFSHFFFKTGVFLLKEPPGTPKNIHELTWLFRFDDSKSVHQKWLFHHFHPLKIGGVFLFKWAMIIRGSDEFTERAWDDVFSFSNPKLKARSLKICPKISNINIGS